MKRELPRLKLPFGYCDTPELRVLDLTAEGLPCIPVLGLTRRAKGGVATTSEEHVHEECIEISYCLRGELAFESCGREYKFRPGCVFVSRPNEPHRLNIQPKGMLMYWMFVRMPKRDFPLLSMSMRESKWLRAALRDMPHRLFTGGDMVRKSFQRVFEAYDSMPAGSPQRTLRLRAGVTDLLLAVLDASMDCEPAPGDDRVARVIEEIRADPVKTFTIDGLASRTSHSPSNLIARFKQLTGLPPQAFRNACRIARAKHELEKGKRSVLSIALSLGYSSAQNFATQFRLATGKTPRAWRNDS
ncbi:MAG: AraC family transcriptional regulator [Kiritimatiellae bacterium]|nr:AraC family transcriptional regulator [Kiritimatiellia bacterium]